MDRVRDCVHGVAEMLGVIALEYSVSRGLRVGTAWLSALTAATMFFVGVVADADPNLWIGGVVGAGFMLAPVLIRRGRFSCRPEGIWARNPVLEYFFPWESIAEVVPGDRVVVVTRDGRRHFLWPVQKSNLAVRLKRRSVVEDAVEQIEEYRLLAAKRATSDAWVTRRIAWLSLREIALVMALGPGAYVLGLFV
jgi:hypothetical protein